MTVYIMQIIDDNRNDSQLQLWLNDSNEIYFEIKNGDEYPAWITISKEDAVNLSNELSKIISQIS